MFLFIIGASDTQIFIHWSHVHTAEVSLLSAVYILYHMDNQIINRALSFAQFIQCYCKNDVDCRFSALQCHWKIIMVSE